MPTLTSAQRRMLRARAHHLQPVVSVGTNGLTPAVLHEIDVNLTAHELVKVRVLDGDRDERDRLLARVCADLDAAPIQHLGKTLTLWRASPAAEAVPIEAKRKTARISRSQVRAGANARRRHPDGNSRRRQA